MSEGDQNRGNPESKLGTSGTRPVTNLRSLFPGVGRGANLARGSGLLTRGDKPQLFLGRGSGLPIEGDKPPLVLGRGSGPLTEGSKPPLVLGRGSGPPTKGEKPPIFLGRGSVLPAECAKPSLFLGRGSGVQGGKPPVFLGRGSGTFLGSMASKSRESAEVGIPPLDANDNVPQPFGKPSAKAKELSDNEHSDIGTVSISDSASIAEDSKSTSIPDSGLATLSISKKELLVPLQHGVSGAHARPLSKLEELQAKLGKMPGMGIGRGSVMLGRGLVLGRGSSLLSGQKPGISEPFGAQPPPLTGGEPPKPSTQTSPVRESLLLRRRSPKRVTSQESSPEKLKVTPGFKIMPPSSGRGITIARRDPNNPPPSLGINPQDQKSKEISSSAGEPCMTVSNRDVVEYHGAAGAKVPVNVNCVQVKCSNAAVYQYHVAFEPDIDNRNLRFSLLNQHREFIGGTKAFDGSILYLPKQLPHNENTLISERVTDGAQIKVTISLTKLLHPASHLLLPFYNVILHRVMKVLKMCPVGRNYYDPACSQAIEKYKLHLWPGYVTAIREMEGGLYMNIDTSHKVLRNETALSLMQDLYRTKREDFRAQCIKELVGRTVLTRYNNNNYRVDDIEWNMTPTDSFTTSKGETIRFCDYYKTQYKIDIKDLKQPMLINRPKKSTQRGKRAETGEEKIISLVPELCFLTGISDKIAGDFTAMKDLGEITRMKPTERNFNIENFLKRIDSSAEAKQELQKWGLVLETRCAPVDARVLPSEKVLVGGNRIFQCNEEVDFFRDISRAPMLNAVPMREWAILFTNRDAKKAQDFVTKLKDVGKNIGMQVHPPRFLEVKDDRSDTFNHAINSVVQPNLQIVVCIFPTSRDDRYNSIKRLCCVDKPVPSQVIISRTLPKDASMGKFRSITMKIALQINCKLGGELWALSIPLDGLMVCGIDVFHEGRAGKGRSVAGLVASMNKLTTRWYSRAVVQQPQQEIIDSLKHCFCDTLTKYHEINHKLPDRIVIYRDGVGDGRLSTVAEHEVKQLQDALKMFDEVAGGKYEPKLTFVVVSKRINIRYYRQTGKAYVNPPPGTILDHTATRPNWPDFYLVSQHVRHGTVSPTHYIVIHGSQHFKPDHIQRLTYKLTHMYYNWPGTVRVPAPCQYAHKLAYLIGENVRKEPALDLCDRLFYL